MIFVFPGGLNSSLVAATLVKPAKEEQLLLPIKTFSIGEEDSRLGCCSQGKELCTCSNCTLQPKHHDMFH